LFEAEQFTLLKVLVPLSVQMPCQRFKNGSAATGITTTIGASLEALFFEGFFVSETHTNKGGKKMPQPLKYKVLKQKLFLI